MAKTKKIKINPQLPEYEFIVIQSNANILTLASEINKISDKNISLVKKNIFADENLDLILFQFNEELKQDKLLSKFDFFLKVNSTSIDPKELNKKLRQVNLIINNAILDKNRLPKKLREDLISF